MVAVCNNNWLIHLSIFIFHVESNFIQKLGFMFYHIFKLILINFKGLEIVINNLISILFWIQVLFKCFYLKPDMKCFNIVI